MDVSVVVGIRYLTKLNKYQGYQRNQFSACIKANPLKVNMVTHFYIRLYIIKHP